MLRAELASDQPVTCRAPVMVGCAPGAACQITLWPLVPESSAASRSGDDSRYTPSASCTTMSPDAPATIERTVLCAVDSEHGCVSEQLVPEPEGEAYRVEVAARAGTVMTTAAAAAVSPAAAVAAASSSRRRPDRKVTDTGSPIE